ncbi:hypothetical protein ES703_61970 [subsurface metagenome]
MRHSQWFIGFIGGVALETFRRSKCGAEKGRAVSLLENAAKHWERLIEVTRQHYYAVPSVQLGEHNFAWQHYRSEVTQDIQIAKKG